ncbi:MAG: hypothetical protein H0U76_10635 [Ktedonobacteraceae bacterium]|nr:hypothetical protein [Ktedonobacteraceae bacterium]MBA3915481.1 hypothetical protein [Terriglobales bacterium]
MKATELRHLLEAALPEAAHAEQSDLQLGHMYLPAGHIKAVALSRPVVVGDRGSGKSFWLKSLVDDTRRQLIGKTFQQEELLSCEVKTGFSPDVDGDYPTPKDLARLVQDGLSPDAIWYAVMVHLIVPESLPGNLVFWKDRISWIQEQSETVTAKLRAKNAELHAKKQCILIAFDGLDRLSPSWRDTVALVRGLLQTQLEFGRYSQLRTKAFIRPDMLASPEVRQFPDASKLLSLAVKLEWEAIDLYGLLWQYLANSSIPSQSAAFRKFADKVAKLSWDEGSNGVFVLTQAVRHDENRQEQLFHQIAGENLGRGKKSGNTWTWLPKHLSDAHGYTSPRSFLVALRFAAVDSNKRKFAGKEFALHTSSLKSGVSEASKVRRHELEENFPWIGDVLKPLKGLGLPARKQDVVIKWKKAETLSSLLAHHEPVPLPEAIKETDPASILAALEQLGLCRLLSDGRIDFPDIVRVDAGMTRKGGIPVR